MQEEIKKQIKELVEKYEFAKTRRKSATIARKTPSRILSCPFLIFLGWNTSDKKEVSAQDHIKGSDARIIHLK